MADSTLSFASYATGEEPLRLSQFPQPPSSVHSVPPGEGDTMTPVPAGRPLDIPDICPMNLRRNETTHDYVDTASPPSYNLHRRDQQIVTSRPDSPQDLRPFRRLPVPPSPTSPQALSSHWHEGSSAIIVDPNEERLLSTSVITHLLSETESRSSDSAIDVPYDLFLPRHRTTDSSSGHSDSRTGITGESEVTYPPPRRQVAYSANRSQPRLVSLSSHRTKSQPFPEAVEGTRRSASTSTFNCTADESLPFRNHVERTLTPTGPESIRSSAFAGTISDHRQSTTSSGVPLNPTFSRMTSRGTNYGEWKLDIPEDVAGPSSMEYSPALPSTAGIAAPPSKGGHRHRQSFHSTRTTKSYVSSLISRISSSTGARSLKQAWRRAKPLPPVPVLPDYTIVQEREWRKIEESLPLPDLVNRAGALSSMLEKGHRPHHSESSLLNGPNRYVEDSMPAPLAGDEASDVSLEDSGHAARATGFWHMSRTKKHQRSRTAEQRRLQSTLNSPKLHDVRTPKKTKFRLLVMAGLVVVIAAIIGTVAGVIHHQQSSAPTCTNNLTGIHCQLDASCVCTTSQPGQCNRVAQAFVSLLPVLESDFNANYTPSSLYTAIWQTQGDVTGANCASQANLIDVGSSLDALKVPNRTSWAHAALLWTLIESQNVTSVNAMRTFIEDAPWNSLGEIDGPVSDSSPKFSAQFSGYVFDFAAQTVTAPNMSFVNAGQPSSEQISRVSSTSAATLDRMYTFAVASSVQRQEALSSYWQAVLQRKASDLSSFLSAFISAPIMIPFDASSSPASLPLADLLNDTSGNQFPPPLACYPGLTLTQMQGISSIETSVFGLSSPSSASNFDPACYPNRPVYGILDVLRLRLPFQDSRTGVAQQAVILKRDVLPRVILHSGEILSALPSSSDPLNISSITTDPREYGTFNNLDHVVLDYLSSLPDVSVANSLIDFVLQSSAVPPSNSTPLFQSLSVIPAIEVAVFGRVDPSDISSTVSSFSTPLGSLFFGSDQGAALRNWVLDITASSISWTDSATAPEVVDDKSLSDRNFLSVWAPTSLFLHTSAPSAPVGVDNITQAFQALGMFSP
ncbi:hypothetical protein NEOLEDRAFT_1173902 [Neolentinus lepideus HHB14362 ss-1]|uniref:Uncharacterized protein n=1 Tax=Neolentinus lepideus HHB14362 ss-1 TaxID=1314782 RepID=A0A165W0K6_9AGAM|nr:hypothetical protein NEOLEDRAFT_1173902 [Neolentinus lepideus HHB14362 ss-1]